MDEAILVVDDEPQVTRSVTNFLNRIGRAAEGATTGTEALKKLGQRQYALMITDIMMPEMDGAELIRRAQREHRELVSMVITALDDVRKAVELIRMGAYDYLVKPFEFEELAICVDRALEHRRLVLENRRYQQELERRVDELSAELHETYQQAIEALAAALDTRDPETREHCVRVTQWAHLIAEKMGITGGELSDIRLGATLHDVGKIGVSDTVLFKPGPLTSEEMEEVKKHVNLGYRMVKDIPFMRGAAPIVRYHHERYDGKGYMHGLLADAIPLGARIFSIADTVDAMTSDRPYRQAMPLKKAREGIVSQSGKQFDPLTVKYFVRATESPNGVLLRQEFEAIAPVLNS